VPATLLAVGTAAVIQTEDGRLISLRIGGEEEPVSMGATGVDGQGTPEQQHYAVYVLVAKWGYSPVFDSKGQFGIQFPEGWRDRLPDPPVPLKRVFLASSDPVMIPADGPPPIPGRGLPAWYREWLSRFAEPPAGWYEGD
jgi:hypothetical protein